MKIKNAVVAGVMALVLGNAWADPTYTAYRISDFGAGWTYGYDVNNSGQVTGISGLGDGSGQQHAFITGANGAGITDIGTLGGWWSAGSAVNASGQVVGSSFTASTTHAFITGPGGSGITDLGTPLWGGQLNASGINNAGQVVGTHIENGTRGFVTGANGVGITLLSSVVHAQDINNSGLVTGMALFPGSDGHAFIYESNGGGMRDLGTLGGKISDGYAINDAGQVTGYSDVMGGYYDFHAFITGADGFGMTDIGALGGTRSIGMDINSSGQVVGMANLLGDSITHAFLYASGEMFDVNTLITTMLAPGEYLYSARGINDSGQIVVHSNFDHTYLLTQTAPVPEPETYAMMLAGLGLLGVFARHRKQKAVA